MPTPWDAYAQVHKVNGFIFEDVLAVYGALVEDSVHPGLYRTDSAMDLQYLMPDTKEDAPSAGLLGTITTGDTGQLVLDLHMFQTTGEDPAVMVMMESSNAYIVAETSDDKP